MPDDKEMVTVTFKVTAPDSMRYWLAVDERDLVVTNGDTSVDLPKGVKCMLVWWMNGNGGDALSVVGKQGEREVVNVKDSKIPKSKTKGAGFKDFKP